MTVSTQAIFFLPTILRWLSQQGTKSKSLADSRGRKMEILLLNVACLSLEGLIAWLPVDKHVT
jgi:hypothetical protein